MRLNDENGVFRRWWREIRREIVVSLAVVGRASVLLRSRNRGSRRENGWWVTVTGGGIPSGSVHPIVRLRCTKQGRHASPVYLSPHLRVLICVRLTAREVEEEEEHRRAWTREKSGFIPDVHTHRSQSEGKGRTKEQRTEQGSPTGVQPESHLVATQSHKGQNVF